MKSRTKILLLLAALVGLHSVVLLAGFVSPYDITEQNRDLPFAPPTAIHFVDSEGKFHLRPSVCSLRDDPADFGKYLEDRSNCFPIEMFLSGSKYTVFGVITSSRHLFGVRAPGRIFLLGTDAFGRDELSRFIYGGRISLFAGLLATVLSLSLGALLGTLAGYYGGIWDSAVMRASELFVVLPWLYLLFAIRAFLPLSLNTTQAFFLLTGVIGLVGWARPARLIRGIVLSSRERPYVLAARIFGGSDRYLISRHILPDTFSVILTQAAILVPQYILAEVTLSFLGLGVAEPASSWGNMLSSVQQYSVLVSYWWMLIPAMVLVPVFAGYQLLANELQGWLVNGFPPAEGRVA